jgi:putative transposase
MTSVNAQQEALGDAWLKESTSPQESLGEHGLLQHLTKRLGERALAAARTAHLGYAPHARQSPSAGTPRTGKGQKTGQTDTGPYAMAVPRDRNGSVAPPLVKKRQRRLAGVEDQVLSVSARGLATRARQAHREALYGTAVSPTLIATITDAGWDAVRTWQSRPLAAVYPILYVDALGGQSRPAGLGQTKAVSLALGLTLDGEKERLGVWRSAGSPG